MVDCKNPLPGLDPTIAANLAAYGSPWGGAQRQVEKREKKWFFFIVNDFKSKLKMKRSERWEGVLRESATDEEHRCLGGVSFYFYFHFFLFQ